MTSKPGDFHPVTCHYDHTSLKHRYRIVTTDQRGQQDDATVESDEMIDVYLAVMQRVMKRHVKHIEIEILK